MNTFTGKQWNAMMAHCQDKKIIKNNANDNLRWPVLSNGHLMFTDSFSILSVKVPIVTVHAADPEYVGGGLTRLDFDIFEKVLCKDTMMVTEDGLFKNGKQISEWRYINTAQTAMFYKVIKDGRDMAGKMNDMELRNFSDHYGIGHKYLSRISDVANSLKGAVRVLPSGGKYNEETKRFTVPLFYCEFATNNEIEGVYAPIRLARENVD